MKPLKFEYFEVIIRQSGAVFEMKSPGDLARYAQAGNIAEIMKATDPQSGKPCFVISHNGALYLAPADDFESLEDSALASANYFPDAQTFYAARQNNCSTFAEYQLVLNTGAANPALVEQMKTGGYLDGFPVFDAMRNKDSALPQLAFITNVKELFDYAKRKQFADFAQFRKLWEAGFTDPIEQQRAAEKGLKTAADYHAFLTGGFQTADEFKTAKANMIVTRSELMQFNDLAAADFEKSAVDEVLLIQIITQLPQSKKIEFSKLYDHLQATEENFKRENDKGERKLYKWYVKRLRKQEDVREFLVKNDEVKKYGTFDAGKSIFETIPINRRKVVVDGSNVAYNSNMADRRAGVFNAHFKNILIMVKKLKDEYKFEDVQVISDNNLFHKAKDREVLKEIKQLCKYIESPPGIPADLYLINHVKRYHCLLVTNDNFNDWKLTDKWLEDNIDFYRLRFMLNDDKVVLPHMERFEENGH